MSQLGLGQIRWVTKCPNPNFLESEWCLLLTNPGGQFEGKDKRLSSFEKFEDGCYRSCIDSVSINLNQNNLHQLHFDRLNFKSPGLFVSKHKISNEVYIYI